MATYTFSLFFSSSHSVSFLIFSLLSFLLVLPTECQIDPTVLSPEPSVTGGNWVLLQRSLGISAMHMQVLRNDKVVMFDRTDFGPSNLSLPSNHCRLDPNDFALTTDCTAHSLLYDIPSNTFRALTVQTDTWCSSGSVLPSGTLVQTGGYNDGERVVRTISPCADDLCDWMELPFYLSVRRWYSSNQILPDGRIIVVGGRKAFSYEFYPKSSTPANYFLRFLKETNDVIGENNLYPFLHLLPDGNLFVFANTRSILLDYNKNQVLREFPKIPGGAKRSYPSTGSSVLLPLLHAGLNQRLSPEAEVMVCGGAPSGAFYLSQQGVFVGASSTCGRLRVTDPDPVWVMEEMPMGRVMPDMLLLPDGDVLILNGAANGTAGWESAIKPVLNPVLYRPYEPDKTRRFSILKPSSIPRLYHSAAVLIPDGRILVGGSNPHRQYNFTGVNYPTELSLEAFSPDYLAAEYSELRPRVVGVETNVSYQGTFMVAYELSVYRPEHGISVTLVAPSFTTHSFAMNQRLVVLNVVSLIQMSASAYQASVDGPTYASVAPPGYYMLFVVHVGIPSHGVWVKVS